MAERIVGVLRKLLSSRAGAREPPGLIVRERGQGAEPVQRDGCWGLRQPVAVGVVGVGETAIDACGARQPVERVIAEAFPASARAVIR